MNTEAATRPTKLVSSKNYSTPELEKFQLMIEHLLERAHRDGMNVWHRSDNGRVPLWIGAVWVTESQYEMRFHPDAAGIVEPARLRSYTRRGTTAENPVLRRPVTDFMEAAHEVFSHRHGKEGARPERFFGSSDANYPSILITLAPQQERIRS